MRRGLSAIAEHLVLIAINSLTREYFRYHVNFRAFMDFVYLLLNIKSYRYFRLTVKQKPNKSL